MKSTAQIVATIGPSSNTKETVRAMIAAGMDVARLNFSHGTHESHADLVTIVRSLAQEMGIQIPVIQDLSGPRMKTDGGHAFDENNLSITEKDIQDLDFAKKLQIEWIAQSYVGSAHEVKELRKHMTRLGINARIIAKIERQVAIDNLDSILREADAVMVARGDLGDAIAIEEVPFVQLDIIHKANELKKPVIVATQMMYSMISNPQPTRAEVTDVAFAILSGTDAVMLSDESARGKYPVETIEYMERIVRRAEISTSQIARHFL